MEKPVFSSSFLTGALGIQKENLPKIIFKNISTDSRTITKDDFFVPLKGDKFDGHDFIPELLKKGVRGFLVRENYEGPFPEDALVLRVSDVLESFRRIARAWREQFEIPVIAVCGSVGKTTTKELLAAILSGSYQVQKTEGSQNGFAGIPMTLLAWQAGIEAAVVEVGIDEPNAMEKHLEIVRPTHGIITALGPEHLERLGDIEMVVNEETKLFLHLTRIKGLSFWNLDEPLLKNLPVPENAFTYSLEDEKADYFAKATTEKLAVKTPDHSLKIPLVMPGVHNARNLLGAVAIAHSLGLTEEEMIEGLKNFTNPKNRFQIESRNGIKWIVDCYNANPTSMQAAFDVLTADYARKPKILILGDMLELGRDEERYHRELASMIQALKPKTVFLFGPRMKWLLDEMKKTAINFPVEHFDSKVDLTRRLSETQSPGDIILLKGSRSMRMEEIL